jgi:hypothetical protein
LDKEDISTSKPTQAEPTVASPARSPSPEVPSTSYRRSKIGLVSPPPSRRQPARKVKQPSTPEASTSKPTKTKAKGKNGKMPIRDSPNNPFLDDDSSPLRMKTPPRRTAPTEEKRTMTYVFRGQKQEMSNPLFGYKPSANSLLPPEHPDFSPDLACPPKLLFPEAHRKRPQAPRLLLGRSPSPASGDDSDDDDSLGKKITPMGKLTVVGERQVTRSSPITSDSQRNGSKRPAGNR